MPPEAHEEAGRLGGALGTFACGGPMNRLYWAEKGQWGRVSKLLLPLVTTGTLPLVLVKAARRRQRQ